VDPPVKKRFVALAQIKQNRTALEDNQVSICESRHMDEGLVSEMLGIRRSNGTLFAL